MSEINKMCYSIPEAVKATCFSRSFIYKSFNNGTLSKFKLGGRTFIHAKELKRFVDKAANNLQDN